MLLTNYIKRLCNAHPSEKDRRITYVELTEAGKTLIEEIFPTHAKRIAEAFEQLSSEELTLLQKLYEK